MRKAVIVAISATALFIAACSEKKENPGSSSTHDFFSGKWKANKLIVVFRGVYGSDKDSVLVVEESEFADKLKSNPHITGFNSDGTYFEEYYDNRDTLLLRNSGTWSTHLDTLSLNQEKPYGRASNYKFTPSLDSLGSPNGLSLFQLVDFDFDGKQDDEYSVIMLPYKEPVEEKSWWQRLFN